jgi:hypothetical protein
LKYKNLVAQRVVLQSTRRVSPAITRPTCQRFFASEHVPETHKRSFGQPTPVTHPNIMKKGEGKKNGLFFSIFFSHSLVYSDTWSNF